MTFIMTLAAIVLVIRLNLVLPSSLLLLILFAQRRRSASVILHARKNANALDTDSSFRRPRNASRVLQPADRSRSREQSSRESEGDELGWWQKPEESSLQVNAIILAQHAGGVLRVLFQTFSQASSSILLACVLVAKEIGSGLFTVLTLCIRTIAIVLSRFTRMLSFSFPKAYAPKELQPLQERKLVQAFAIGRRKVKVTVACFVLWVWCEPSGEHLKDIEEHERTMA